MKDYIYRSTHPSKCVCGSKDIEMSNFVMTSDPPIFSWWCNTCGQTYRVQANGIGMVAEYEKENDDV